ncbi:hypothetical protein JTE90_011009 [Oedothorax gibbosus]|uniref:Tesmin/TSO1-like CXC domain-containing protein n=1 Tax=Oedothorax gibbosus TaxID=931172 RepID=A0AAV6VFF9_9ARAC|nr:hypothetical protein JTE90_011009 [Oedothorax gibbosus]
MLESAYFKVNSLNEKLLEIEENDKELRNKLKTFCDILSEVAVDMTPAAVMDNEIKIQKEKIEAVQVDCYRIWLARCQDAVEIDVKDNESYKNIGNADEEESELNNSGDASEEESENPFGSGKKLFEEVQDRQTVRVNKLSSIQYELQVKENMCEQLNFIQDHMYSSITEGKEILLENQIKQLIQEKTDLIKRMENEKLDSKENAAKVEKYEEKLQELQEELQKVKRSLQMRWETTEKVNMLKKQIEELKKHRINLVKERNQASKQCLRIEQEKNKDIMQLKRKERKQDLQRTRMAENYESKIRVLEARVSRYEISRLTQYKNKNIKVEKPKSTLVNTGESIEAKVKIAIENNLMKLELEEMEQDADSLEQNIKKMEELSPDESKDTYVIEMKAKLNVLLEKIGTMKKNSLETKNKSCVLLDSLPNLPAEAKTVVKTLLNKCVKAKVELTKHLNECNENFEKNKNDMEKKMQLLINESELATQDLEKKIEYLESQLNLKQQEELQNQEAKEFKELTNFPSKELQLETNTSDADGNEETEELDKKIKNLQATCDEKNAEVAELKNQIKDLQTRKRTRKWLTRLSTEDADTSEVHGKESMLEAYFSTDNEESFCNDPNDPDWRATPLHKQAKRRRFQVSAENSETKSKGETDPSSGSLESVGASSENDFLMPAKPKNKCQCVGDCKSNRCKCKKNNVVCTEACKCLKTRYGLQIHLVEPFGYCKTCLPLLSLNTHLPSSTGLASALLFGDKKMVEGFMRTSIFLP